MDGTPHASDSDPYVLNANRNDGGRRLNANWDKPGNQWNDNGLFAFPVPATLFISPSLAPRLRGSFVFAAAPASHRTFCPPCLLLQKGPHTFCPAESRSPKGS